MTKLLVFIVGMLIFQMSHSQMQPGVKTAMQEAVVGDANFKLRIHAPQQSTPETLDALDAVLKIEEALRRADEEDYVAQKQRLLQIQKNRIRDIVRAAFEPVHAMIPNPVAGSVVEQLRPVMTKVSA